MSAFWMTRNALCCAQPDSQREGTLIDALLNSADSAFAHDPVAAFNGVSLAFRYAFPKSEQQKRAASRLLVLLSHDALFPLYKEKPEAILDVLGRALPCVEKKP